MVLYYQSMNILWALLIRVPLNSFQPNGLPLHTIGHAHEFALDYYAVSGLEAAEIADKSIELAISATHGRALDALICERAGNPGI